jgi:two-component system nitrate/nitrite response regulator NarL
MMVTYRVLLVDDHERWRRHVTSTLQRKAPRWQVIGEASDGLGAVEKAQTLQPDLILLDVGLPKLNGIEVANRILAEAPHKGGRLPRQVGCGRWTAAGDVGRR